MRAQLAPRIGPMRSDNLPRKTQRQKQKLSQQNGIKDEKALRCCGLMIGEQGQISHYVAERTGREYFSAPAQGYAAALEKILMQLHFRYELGFIPPVIEVDRPKRTCPVTRLTGDLDKTGDRTIVLQSSWFSPAQLVGLGRLRSVGASGGRSACLPAARLF